MTLTAQLDELVRTLPPASTGEVVAFSRRIAAGEPLDRVAFAVRARMHRLIGAARDTYLSREDAHARLKALRAVLEVVAQGQIGEAE